MVKIKLENVSISGNASVLNNMRISGHSDVRIELSNVTIRDNSSKPTQRPDKR